MSVCYIPEGGALVESCTRTMQGRLLLRSGKEENDLMLGAVGRAMEYAKVDVFALNFQSNHYHMLYWVDHGLQMARFQNHLNSSLARELGRFHDWREKFWGRRYRPMVVSDEPEAQWERLEYVLGQGVGSLVGSPLDWPGPSAAKALVHDEPLVGHWYNRTKEWDARRRGLAFEKYDFATRYEIRLRQLPAFRAMDPVEYRQRVAELIEKIEREAAARRAQDPERRERPVPRPAWVLAEDPHKRPKKVKKSPAPKLFYASDIAKIDRMRDDYDVFEAEYYRAADRLDALARLPGDESLTYEFPFGCFPRGLPCVGVSPFPMVRTPPSRELKMSSDDETMIVFRGEIPTVQVPAVGAAPAAARSARASPARA